MLLKHLKHPQAKDEGQIAFINHWNVYLFNRNNIKWYDDYYEYLPKEIDKGKRTLALEGPTSTPTEQPTSEEMGLRTSFNVNFQ